MKNKDKISKKSFLGGVAVAVVGLVGGTAAVSNSITANEQSKELKFKIPNDSLLISPSQENIGNAEANHKTHYSHRSHSSHRSHYSSYPRPN
jgi:hypothetical protein